MKSQQIIEILNLTPHPEGGYYARTYESATEIQTKNGSRFLLTSIYYLVESHRHSTLHRIRSDELWHFYDGSPYTLVQISPDGELKKIILGKDLAKGQTLQHCVPAGYWFGGFTEEKNSYSLMGCCVSPGFAFEDFELGKKNTLLQLFPQHKTMVERLSFDPA